MKSYFVVDGKIYSPIKQGRKLRVRRWGLHPYRVIEIHEYRVNSTFCDFDIRVDELYSSKEFYSFLDYLRNEDDFMWTSLSPRTVRVFTKDLDV